MSTELIVAGGTGQEIAAAVFRLAYLAGLAPPSITVIDSDTSPFPVGTASQERSTPRTRTEVLQRLHNALRDNAAIQRDCLTFINPAHLPAREAPIHTVCDLFGVPQGAAPTNTDRALLEVLLDDNQRNVTINDGFHGHPAVGSFVVAGATRSGSFQELWKRLESEAREDEGVRVVIAGSLAGGTGTAVLPVFAQELGTLRVKAGEKKVRVHAILHLPWFNLVKVEGDILSRPPDVDRSMFDRNAVCLVQGYLQQVLEQCVDSVLLFGLPKPVSRVSHGGRQQLETKHYLNVVAAIYTLNLLDVARTQAMLGKEPSGFYAPSVAVDPSSAGFDGQPNGPSLCLSAQRRLSLRTLIDLARSLAALSTALVFEAGDGEPRLAQHRDVARGLKRIDNRDGRLDFCKTLDSFDWLHKEICAWLQDSLAATVGATRADNIHAFVPEDNDWTGLFESRPSSVLWRLKTLPQPALGRRLLRRLGPFGISGSHPTGKAAAWTLVSSGRNRLLRDL